jgi:hypothetical protein
MDLREVTGILMSAERPIEGTSEFAKTMNAIRSAKMVAELLDAVGFDALIVPTEGAWEGQTEQSYLIIPTEESKNKPLVYRNLMYKVLAIASEFEQDAVMTVHEGTAHLVELPTVPTDLSREARMDQLYSIMTYDQGETLLSDRLSIHRMDKELALMLGEYTKVDDEYFVMI